MRLAALALVGLCVAAAPARLDVKLGEVVPDITFKGYDDKEYKLSDFRADAEKKTEGMVTVVYFHSEKCPAQVPLDAIKKVAEQWSDPKNGVKFLAFFSYGHDTQKAIGEYITKNTLTYTSAWDTDRKLRDHFGAKQVNTTYVLDKNGKLIYHGGLFQMKGKPPAWTVEKETVVEAVKAAKEGTAAPKSGTPFMG